MLPYLEQPFIAWYHDINIYHLSFCIYLQMRLIICSHLNRCIIIYRMIILTWTYYINILVIFHFDSLPFWSSSILIVFNFCRLPFWSSSILFIFHFDRLPYQSSSTLVAFHFGHLQIWSSSLKLCFWSTQIRFWSIF